MNEWKDEKGLYLCTAVQWGPWDEPTEGQNPPAWLRCEERKAIWQRWLYTLRGCIKRLIDLCGVCVCVCQLWSDRKGVPPEPVTWNTVLSGTMSHLLPTDTHRRTHTHRHTHTHTHLPTHAHTHSSQPPLPHTHTPTALFINPQTARLGLPPFFW